MKNNFTHKDIQPHISKKKMEKLLSEKVSIWMFFREEILTYLVCFLPLLLSFIFHLVLDFSDNFQGIYDLLDTIFLSCSTVVMIIGLSLYFIIKYYKIIHTIRGMGKRIYTIAMMTVVVLTIASFPTCYAYNALADLITDETEVHTGEFEILYARRRSPYNHILFNDQSVNEKNTHSITNATCAYLQYAKTIQLESWRRTGVTKSITVIEWKSK